MQNCDIIFYLGEDIQSEDPQDKVYIIKDAFEKSELSDFPLKDVAKFLLNNNQHSEELLDSIRGFFKKTFITDFEREGVLANTSLEEIVNTIPVEGGWDNKLSQLKDFKKHNILYIDQNSPNFGFVTTRDKKTIILYRNGLLFFKNYLDAQLLLQRNDITEDKISPQLKQILNQARKETENPGLTIKKLLQDFLANSQYLKKLEYRQGYDPLIVLESEAKKLLGSNQNLIYGTDFLTALQRRITSPEFGDAFMKVQDVVKMINTFLITNPEKQIKIDDYKNEDGTYNEDLLFATIKKLIDEDIKKDPEFPFRVSKLSNDIETGNPDVILFKKVGRNTISELTRMNYAELYVTYQFQRTYRGYRIYKRTLQNGKVRYYFSPDLIDEGIKLTGYNTEEEVIKEIENITSRQKISEGVIQFSRWVESDSFSYAPSLYLDKKKNVFKILQIQEYDDNCYWKTIIKNETVSGLISRLNHIKERLEQKEYKDQETLFQKLNEMMNNNLSQEEIARYAQQIRNLYQNQFDEIRKLINVFIEQKLAGASRGELAQTISNIREVTSTINYRSMLVVLSAIREDCESLKNKLAFISENVNKDNVEKLSKELEELKQKISNNLEKINMFTDNSNLIDLRNYLSKINTGKEDLTVSEIKDSNQNLKLFIKKLNNSFSERLFFSSNEVDAIINEITDADKALGFIHLISSTQDSTSSISSNNMNKIVNELHNAKYKYYEVIDDITNRREKSKSKIVIEIKDPNQKLKSEKENTGKKKIFESVNKAQCLSNIVTGIGQMLDGTGYTIRLMTQSEIDKEFNSLRASQRGFVTGQTIVINSTLANLSTPLHEFIHVFFGMIKAINPEAYQNLLQVILSNQDIAKSVNWEINNIQNLYRGMAYSDLVEEAFANVYANFILKKNDRFFEQDFRFNTMALSDEMKNMFDLSNQIKNANIEDILSLPLVKLSDLISNIKALSIKGFDTAFKEEQLKQINQKMQQRRKITNYIRKAINDKRIIENCKII